MITDSGKDEAMAQFEARLRRMPGNHNRKGGEILMKPLFDLFYNCFIALFDLLKHWICGFCYAKQRPQS